MGKKYKHGLVIGKFLPLHKGHMYLIETAASQCDRLTIMVGSLPNEPIEGHRRYEWVKYTYPQHKVIHSVEDALPDWFAPGYWYHWAEMFYHPLLKKAYGIKGPLGRKDLPYAVFTSEDYGVELARVIEAEHVLVDKERVHVPVSATKIRTNPMEYWDYIAPIARPYFVKRILLIGGESCGKTTMAEYLANHFNTVWVPEFARPYMALYGNDFYEKIADDIILGQMKIEEEKALEANRIMFCDTDNLVTREYADEYGFIPPEYMKRLANEKRYDLYLFLDNDLDWEDDGMRNKPKRRGEVKQMFLDALDSRRIPYTMIHGHGQARFDMAVSVVEDYMKGVS